MKKVVVIGGVAAGLKTASKIMRCDPEVQVTVVERGSVISYGACGMPYYVAGDVPEISHLMATASGNLRSPSYFKNVKGFDVLTETLAIKIDRTNKLVVVRSVKTGEQTELPYDKLVIATGASPIVPPIPGIQIKNIHQLWHPDDAKAVRDVLDRNQVKQAVIIGAGLVGMEMAEAFHRRNIPVTVVEMRDRLFPAFLDTEIAASVQKHLTELGITVLTNEKVTRFNGIDTVREVVTDMRTIPADLVILSVGVKPNIELARDAGLTIGVTGAIAANEYLETSDPDIYAGGDCVENTNMITGGKVFAPMGSTANKHGRVIGENICGDRARFKGVLNTVVVRLLDMNVGKVGLNEKDVKEAGYDYISAMVSGHDKPHYMPGSKLITIKLIADVRTRKILGAQAFGEGEVAKRIDVIATMLTMGGTIDDLFDIDLGYAPPFSSPIDNVAVAANSLTNKLKGKWQGISPLSAKELMAEGKTVFLDVRSPEECSQLRMAKTECKDITYIPLGQLRARLAELSKDDEIVAFCKIGLRGYETALILQGEGYDRVKVLEGGIAAWPFCCDKSKDETADQ